MGESSSQATKELPESSSSSCRITGHRPVGGHLAGIGRTLDAVTSGLAHFFLYSISFPSLFFFPFLSRRFVRSFVLCLFVLSCSAFLGEC